MSETENEGGRGIYHHVVYWWYMPPIFAICTNVDHVSAWYEASSLKWSLRRLATYRAPYRQSLNLYNYR